MTDPSWSRLRNRLIAVCAGVTATGLLLIGLDLLREYHNTLDRAGRETAALARVLDEQTQRSLEAVDHLIRGLVLRADETGSMDGAAPSFAGMLGEKLADFPQISSVFLFNAAGEQVIARRRIETGLPPINIADRDHFRLHRADAAEGLLIGPPLRGQLTGRWVVPMSRGVWRDGQFLGVVLASIDIGYLRDLFHTIDIGPRGLASLTRFDGTTIVRLPEPGGGEADGDTVDAAILGAAAGTLDSVSAIDGVRRRLSYRTVGDSGLVVSVGFAYDDFLAGWRRTLWIEGGAAAMLFVLGLAAGLFLARGLGQQRRIEDLRVERESFARASEAKTAFLANMSHELRTPLNAILGFAQLMQSEAFGPLGNKRYHDYSNDIVHSGEHLLRLLDGILDLSRIDTQRLTLEEKGFALARLLADARSLARARAEMCGVAIVLEDRAPGTMIRADQRRLTHALANLLDNAVKFSPAAGTVRLSAARDADGRLVILVADDGPGMSAEEAEAALSPWCRLSSAITGRGEGSGLGLPLARSVAELHGGVLRFLPGRAVGAMAEFSLPAERILAPSPSGVDTAAADRRSVFVDAGLPAH